jgi:nucleoside 2-deoxyribosyltransferase
MKPTVYLAGPITNTSYGECTSWRHQVAEWLAPDIDAFSPLRAKNYLEDLPSMPDNYNGHILSTQRAIYTRDHHDCRTKDLIFINLLGASRVSIGTVMELAWSAAYNKLNVLVMENFDNVHDHAMLREACPIRVDTLEDGVAITRALLLK